MNVTIQPGRAVGYVTVPSSKSMAHRMLICAGLSSGTSQIGGIDLNEDILATIACLRALGADCSVSSDTVTVRGVDMKRAKETVGKNNCITGNLSLYTLEFGTKQQTIDETKRLLDICAPGGGYVFGCSGCVEYAKVENLEAMFETLETYGRY